MITEISIDGLTFTVETTKNGDVAFNVYKDKGEMFLSTEISSTEASHLAQVLNVHAQDSLVKKWEIIQDKAKQDSARAFDKYFGRIGDDDDAKKIN